MRISKLAKVASLALAFGLVTGTPAHAVDLQGSGASFPALLIEGCKAGFAASGSGHTYVYASSSSGTGQANSDKSIGDFWMSDGAYTASTKRASLIHVPLVAAPIEFCITFHQRQLFHFQQQLLLEFLVEQSHVGMTQQLLLITTVQQQR